MDTLSASLALCVGNPLVIIYTMTYFAMSTTNDPTYKLWFHILLEKNLQVIGQ